MYEDVNKEFLVQITGATAHFLPQGVGGQQEEVCCGYVDRFVVLRYVVWAVCLQMLAILLRM